MRIATWNINSVTARLDRLLEWLELRMYAAANHVVTVGEGYRRELVAKGVPEKRITAKREAGSSMRLTLASAGLGRFVRFLPAGMTKRTFQRSPTLPWRTGAVMAIFSDDWLPPNI